jgi:hypothetical protein
MIFVNGSDIDPNCKYDFDMTSRRAFIQVGAPALQKGDRKECMDRGCAWMSGI